MADQAAGGDAALSQVSAELYALPPEEFTAARNARAKAAQAAGERELAARIKKLGRPTAAASLANLLVREDPEAVQPLVELGVGLRKATAALDGAQMRALSREQQKVVTTLVRRAAALARESGRRVTEQTTRDLDATLRAAVADASSAEQLMAGQLSEALQHTGFGPTPTGHLTVVREGQRPAAESPPETETDPRATPKTVKTKVEPERESKRESKGESKAQQAAHAAVDKAEAAMEEAFAARKQASAQLAEAGRRTGETRAEADAARAALKTAEADHARARRDEARARAASDKAAQALRAAARRLEDANSRLEDLS